MILSPQFEPKTIRLIREPGGSVSLSIAGQEIWRDVQVLRAAPLSDPEHFISILDREGEEIAMIADPSVLDAATRRIVREELDHRYISVKVRRLHSVRNESGVSYFDVQTDHGRREFVVQNIDESVRRLGNGGILISDADGSRFEIPPPAALDRKSAKLLAEALA